ncbi:ThiF family adenylyltransferase [Paenibacillus humicola]|uniref:ThiF family adenylyltransferase n=1 Tax=Paenibacillus humicola TaxID=3110540 RepID=UPI0030841D0C
MRNERKSAGPEHELTDSRPDLAADQDQWADRYSRQTRFTPIGAAGQQRLGGACVLIVGSGALGASLAQHMTRAGIGTVRLVDRDFVEPSNLQRQMLFDEADALASLPKAVAAAAKLRRINSEIVIEPHVADVTEDNVDTLAAGADLVLDGTDNARTRLLLSDACFKLGIPFLYGGVAGAQGMSAVLVPGETACLRCLIGGTEDGEAVDTCDTVGVISPIVEWIAALQAAEALKWLSGNRGALRRTWLTADLWPFRIHESALPGPSASCPCCGLAEISASQPGTKEMGASIRGTEGMGAPIRAEQKLPDGQTAIEQRKTALRTKSAESAGQDAGSLEPVPVAAERGRNGMEPAATESGRAGKEPDAAERERNGMEPGAAECGRTATEPAAVVHGQTGKEPVPAERERNGMEPAGRDAVESDAGIYPEPPQYEPDRTADLPPRSAAICGRDSVQVTTDRSVDLERLQGTLESAGCAVTSNPYLIRVSVPDGLRLAIFPDGRVLVQGTQDTRLAETVCMRYLTPQRMERSETG